MEIKNFTRFIVSLVALVLFACQSVFATHIVGSELSYDYLGNDQYRINLTIYRDGTSGTGFDNPAILGVFNSSNVRIDTIQMPFGSFQVIPPTINNPCVQATGNANVEVTTYTKVVTLPPIPGGYQLAYQRCCRNAGILNVQNANNTGATAYSVIPDVSTHGNNSSPRFVNLAPLYLCANLQYSFNHFATDPDGDSLVYSMCTPFEGLSSTTPAGIPTNPPYTNITWQPPYSQNDQLGGVPLTINSQNGFMTGTPNTIGRFVVGVCVQEYRNGVLINETRRDFQFNIISCNFPIAANFGTIAGGPQNYIQCNTFVGFTNTSTYDPNANISFEWDFGVPGISTDTSSLFTPTYNYPGFGNYLASLIVTDSASGCADTAYQMIQIVDSVLPVDAGADVSICVGQSTQLTATGALSYTWTPATGLNNASIPNPVASPTSTTTYYVTGVNSVGCSGIDSVTVTVQSATNLTVSNDTTICEGDCAQLLASGGISYAWSPAAGLNDSTLSNPIACPTTNTTYTVTALVPGGNIIPNGDFEQGNTGFSSSYTYQSNLQPESTYYVDSSANLHHNGFNGFDHTNPPSGNFMIINGSGTPNTNVWCHTVAVTPNTDYAFSTWVSSVNPGSPAILQFSINGQTLGTPFNAPNQTGVWTQFYQTWNSGSNTTANICIVNQNTTTGGNDFGLDDISFATFCTVTEQVTVSVNTLPVINATADTAICEGGSVQLTASGGGSYSWSPSAGLSNANIANPVATPAVTTTYIVTVTSLAQCVAMDTVTITVNPNPTADAGADTTICFGDSTQLNASGGDTYSWSPSTGLSNATISNPFAFPASTTDYVVTATTTTGCSDMDTVRVTVNPVPVITAGPDTILCLGDTVQLLATGASIYSWSPATGLSATNIANPQAFPIVSTAYVVTGTDSIGCAGTDTVQIDVFQVITSSDTAICFGDTAHISATGGSSWVWSPTTGLSDPNIQNPDASPSTTTTYTVTAIDTNGCVSIDTVTVTVVPLPIANAGGDVEICRGNSAQLNATGGVFYSWSPTFGLDNPNISNPVATPNDTIIYVVTVSDSIGCSDSDSITIFVNPPPVPDAGADTAICVGESAQLQASGGRIYTWSPTTGLSNPNIANPVATPNTTTTYTVNVQAPSGQQFINADFEQGNTGFNTGYNYNTPTTLVPGQYTITTNANAANPAYQGNMDHTTGSGNFMVVNGQFTTNTSVWCQTVNVAPNTDYYIGVWVNTLNNGDPALLQFTADGTPTGSPFLAPPFGLNNWFEYYNVWNSGNNTTVTICLQNLTTTTGPTGFGIDDLVFGPLCEDNDQVTVTVNPLPQVDAGQDENICLGESAQLQATGADTYNWSPTTFLNNTSVSNPVSTPLSATSITYTVTGTDTNGCVNSDQVTVTASTPPTATVSPNTFVCEGQSTTLTASGGSSYSWSPSTGLSSTNTASTEASPTTTTTYTVIVSDQNSCDDTTQVTVTVYPLPTADAGADIELCYGEVAQLTATGGTSYSWTPANYLSNANVANPQATPTEDITYTVTVTDIHGCQNQDSVNIAVFRVTAGPDSSLCMGDSIQLFVSGGTSFQWSPATGLSNPNISNPLASPTETTIYTVTAMDANGCEDEAELTLQILAAPIAGFMMEFLPSCEGIMGYFENTSEDGVSYIWDFGDGTTAEAMNPTHLFEVGPGAVVKLITFNGEGCADTITVDSSSISYFNDNFDLVVGNALTPNSDGKNDCFLPSFDGAFNDCFEMQVFNRWGALIFESVAQGDCWDGRNKAGQIVAEGTYYYILNVNGFERKGFIEVLY